MVISRVKSLASPLKKWVLSTPSPRIMWFPLARFPLTQFLAYVRVSGEFHVSWTFSTVPLARFLRNAVFQRTKKRAMRGIGVVWMAMKLHNFCHSIVRKIVLSINKWKICVPLIANAPVHTYYIVTTHVRGVAKGQLRLVILYYGPLKVELPRKSKEAYLYTYTV